MATVSIVSYLNYQVSNEFILEKMLSMYIIMKDDHNVLNSLKAYKPIL